MEFVLSYWFSRSFSFGIQRKLRINWSHHRIQATPMKPLVSSRFGSSGGLEWCCALSSFSLLFLPLVLPSATSMAICFTPNSGRNANKGSGWMGWFSMLWWCWAALRTHLAKLWSSCRCSSGSASSTLSGDRLGCQTERSLLICSTLKRVRKSQNTTVHRLDMPTQSWGCERYSYELLSFFWPSIFLQRWWSCSLSTSKPSM